MIKEQISTGKGSIETGRSIDYYTWDLFFEPQLCEGKRILNLGAGSSNLEKDLKRKKINCSVLELDLTYDPYINRPIKPLRTMVATLIDRHIKGNKKREMIRRIMGTKGREMVQAAMAQLPFPDKSFDIVFAYHSTYQIPREKNFKFSKKCSEYLRRFM